MSREATQARPPALTPASGHLLQRKCACGQHTVAGGECEACRKKRLGLQREVIDQTALDVAPPIVHEVLASPGQPLDPQTRAFMEPRFGHDFSGVRVHTDGKAAKSARAVNALAYTIGRDMVFGAGQYAPQTSKGRRLMTHELTHVVQQQGYVNHPSANYTLGSPVNAAEREAESVAQAVGHNSSFPAVVTESNEVQRFLGDWMDWAGKSVAAVAVALKMGSFKVNMTPFVTGLSGTIEFDPDPKKCPKCKLIRLVQIVRVFEKPGKDYTWSDKEAPREKVKTTKDKTKGVKANYFVDHLAANCSAGKGCSIYYRDHAANATLSQDGSNDGKIAKKVSLWDRPFGDADDIFEFETCARCNDTGVYLRCVDWGFRADSSGKVTPRATSEHIVPSTTFNAALATFNKYYGNK